MSRYYLSMSAVLLVCFVAAGVFRSCQKEPPASIDEAKEILDNAGLHCILVERGGSTTLIVSDQPFDPDPDFGFQWQYTTGWDKGKVLVFSHRVLNYPSTRTVSWGAISATGDDALLRKIDGLFR